MNKNFYLSINKKQTKKKLHNFEKLRELTLKEQKEETMKKS